MGRQQKQPVTKPDPTQPAKISDGCAAGFVCLVLLSGWGYCLSLVVQLDAKLRQHDADLTEYTVAQLSHHRLAAVLTPPAKQSPFPHEEKYAQIHRLFPSEREWQMFVRWGQEIAANRDPKNYDPENVVVDFAIEDGWRRLTGRPGVQLDDLYRLKEVIETAVPDPQQRRQLLAWAEQRRTEKAVPPLPRLDGSRTTRWIEPAVPDLDWFRYWILYEELCVTPEMFAARKASFIEATGGKPSRYGHDLWKRFLEFGSQLAEERRNVPGHRFPPASEQASFLAACDYLLGVDPRSVKLREMETTTDHPGKVLARLIGMAFYPNDDMALGVCGVLAYDPEMAGEAGRINDKVPPDKQKWFRWLGLLSRLMIFGVVAGVYTIPIARGVRAMLQAVILRDLALFLGLRSNPKLLSYRGFVATRPGFRLRLGILLVAWLLTPFTFDSMMLVLSPDWLFLLLGVLLVTVTGGVLIDALSHLNSLMFIRLGFDPQRSWLDEIVTAILATVLLWLCGNNPVAIVAAVGFGMSTSVLYKFTAKPHEGVELPAEDASSPNATA